MPANADDKPLLLCPGCGRPFNPGEHLCAHCNAPLTAHAHSDPFLGIFARGYAISKATSGPVKGIVVVGMWLWCLPVCLGTSGIAIFGLGASISALAENKLADLVMMLPFSVVMGVIGWALGMILFRTTSNYLKQKRRTKGAGAGISTDSTNEPIEEESCLSCGEPIPPDRHRCENCGWSFSNS